MVVLAVAGMATAVAQNYTVYKFTKGVQVETGGKTVAPTEGMALKPNDMLIIPQGGSVSIHDKASGDIYNSVSTGRVSVTKLKIEAARSAGSRSSNIMAGVNSRFGGGGSGNGRVYVEKGMVNRSLAVYDPDGDTIEMAPEVLAAYIASHLLQNRSDALPLELAYGEKGDGGLYFRMENTLDYPVYFNVLKLSPSEAQQIEISPLGQPNGSYVLLPRQAIQREHLSALPEGERQVVILTPCQFELDTVIEHVNGFMQNPESNRQADDTAACVVFIN